MVVTSTPSTASAAEERKRTMAMERAKAAHLSRQLQLRLQYARLKVEHGWQKQNLNEVENLYFRHSHTKPRQSPKDQTLMTLSVSSATQQSPKISNVPDFQTSSSSSTAGDTSETVEGMEAFLQPSAHTSPTPQALASESPTPSIPENAPVSGFEPSPMTAESTAAIPTVAQTRHQPTEFSTTPQLTVTHKQGAPESVPTYPITSYVSREID
ncbi:hypothetical protein L218DRAFT_547550 [Marasmius fiardii PR-910]|nr:hypothetical protein L218DRAFT_547550 [Marasmius fiardii PR-910]